jgi:hypothetical protein
MKSAYTLDRGAIIGPSGVHLVSLVRAQHGDGAVSETELDRFRRQILDALNADPNRPDLIRSPVEAAQAALDGHDAALRLEPGNGPRVALFHLLASLVEWADAQSPRVDFDAVLGEVREHFAGERDPLDEPAQTAVVRCADRMGNVAFVRWTERRGWACVLANGTPASMFYAGVPSGEETETVIALDRAKTVADVLRIMKARARQSKSVELEA